MSTSSQPWSSQRKLLSSPCARDREAAGALPPRNRHAARRDAARRRAGREIGHAGRVRSAGLRRGELAAVDGTGLVPAPHERAIEPAVLPPERQHADRRDTRSSSPGARADWPVREDGASLGAERQPHRREGIGGLGGHARGRGLRPARPVLVAIGPRRAGPPITGAHAVVGEEGVEAVRDARPALAGSSAPRADDGGDVGLRLNQEERAEGRRIVARRQLHAEHAQAHRQRRERLPVAREHETALVDAGGCAIGHAEAQHEPAPARSRSRVRRWASGGRGSPTGRPSTWVVARRRTDRPCCTSGAVPLSRRADSRPSAWRTTTVPSSSSPLAASTFSVEPRPGTSTLGVAAAAL